MSSDVFTATERSRVMSCIRGRGNRSTEMAMISLLRAAHIKGWRRHIEIRIENPSKMPLGQKRSGARNTIRKQTVHPDFVFRAARLAIFVDGCFWHHCPMHFSWPKNNAQFWRNKIEANVARDRSVDLALKRKGWRVMHLWEHEMRTPVETTRKLKRRLKATLIQKKI